MRKAIRNYIHNSIHNTTAKICEDVAQPPGDVELKEPAPIRRWLRLVVTALAGAVLVAAIVFLTQRIPKLQSERHMFSPNSTSDEVDKVLRKNSTSLNPNCPCQNQAMSWCNVTTFYLYKASHKGANSTITRTFNWTNGEGGLLIDTICSSNNSVKQNICEHVLGPVINSDDKRTILPTASAFLSPELLYNEIALRIDTNAYEQSSAFFFLDLMNKTDSSNYSKALTGLIREMQFQFLKNPNSSAEDYWNAGKDIRGNNSLSFSYGMEVSWERYLQVCKPAFCDIQFEIGVVNRVVRAVGQVGGVTTVIALALKFLVWPSLRFFLGFPTSKSLSSDDLEDNPKSQQ